MFWKFFILSLFSVGDCILITKIQDNIMVGIMNNMLFNITQDQCICEMIQSNDTISALNYFPTNQTCQLYHSNISSVFIEFYSGSSFIFINQSVISISNIKENSKFILRCFISM
jgi:outer membrane phospholipase A